MSKQVLVFIKIISVSSILGVFKTFCVWNFWINKHANSYQSNLAWIYFKFLQFFLHNTACILCGASGIRSINNNCGIKLVYYETSQRNEILHLKNERRKRIGSGFKKIRPKINFSENEIQLYVQTIGTCCWRAHQR